MSGKVVLTKRQEAAMKSLRNAHITVGPVEFFASSRGKDTLNDYYDCLESLTVDEFAEAYYGDYEVKLEETDFNEGDFVVKKDGSDIHNGKLIATYKGENFLGIRFFEDLPGAFIADGLRKATEEEIYWLHELGRDKICDFREGDVIITQEVSYRYSTDGGVDTIGPHTTQLWLDEGIIKGIYPVESFKPFKKEQPK